MKLITILQLVPFMFVIFQFFSQGNVRPATATALEAGGVVQCFYCSATEANGMCKGHSYDAYGPCSGFCLKIALHTDRDGVDGNILRWIRNPQNFRDRADYVQLRTCAPERAVVFSRALPLVNNRCFIGINAVDDIIAELVANSVAEGGNVVDAASTNGLASSVPKTSIAVNSNTTFIAINSTTSRPSTTTTMEHMMDWLNNHGDTEQQQQAESTTPKKFLGKLRGGESVSNVRAAGENEISVNDGSNESYRLDFVQQRAQFRRFSQFIHNELNDRISLSYVCGCDNADFCNRATASLPDRSAILAFLLVFGCGFHKFKVLI